MINTTTSIAKANEAAEKKKNVSYDTSVVFEGIFFLIKSN